MNLHGSKIRNKRGKPKPKVRWEQLGLTDPADTIIAPSIDEIRREVTLMASRGLGQGTRSRNITKVPPVEAGLGGEGRPKRRGATE